MHPDRKRAIIVVSVVALTLVFWLVAKNWMNSPVRFNDWTAIIFSSVLLAIAASAIALALLLLARGKWLWFLLIGVSLAFLAAYGPSWLYFAGVIIAILLWRTSARNAIRELADRRKIRIASILTHSLPKVLLGMYVLLSFAFYMTPASHNITQSDATTIFQHQLDRTYSTVLQSELAKLPAGQREEAKAAVSAQVVQSFVRFLNFQFCLTDTVCTPTILQLLPPIYAFIFFLLLLSFGFVFNGLGSLVGSGTFQALKKFQIIHIDQEEAKVDVLKL